jgi:hypothetical protein
MTSRMHILSSKGGVPGHRVGEHLVAVEIARCSLAIRRRDWLAAEHHAVAAQRALVALQRGHDHREDGADA